MSTRSRTRKTFQDCTTESTISTSRICRCPSTACRKAWTWSFCSAIRWVVAAGTTHRWANRRKIDFAELAGELWLLPRTDSWNYICIADAFRSRGLPGPKIGLWSNDAALRTQLLAKGSAVTAMGKLNAQWYGLKVLPIDLPVQPWPVVIATLRGRTLSPVVELLIEFVRDFTKPMRAANGVPRRRLV